MITRELLIEAMLGAAFTSPIAKKLVLRKLKMAKDAGDSSAVALLRRLKDARADRAVIQSGGSVAKSRIRHLNRYQYKMNRQARRIVRTGKRMDKEADAMVQGVDDLVARRPWLSDRLPPIYRKTAKYNEFENLTRRGIRGLGSA